MSVGLLLISHEHVASGLLAAARSICGEYSGGIEEIEISHDAKPKNVINEIEHKIKLLDNGAGVLILSDLAGLVVPMPTLPDATSTSPVPSGSRVMSPLVETLLILFVFTSLMRGLPMFDNAHFHNLHWFGHHVFSK